MTGDCHAGICGSPGVGFPRATRPGPRWCPGISLGDIRLLARWCPAYRQHESGIRLCTEHVNGCRETAAGKPVARKRVPGGRIREGQSMVARHAGGPSRVAVKPGLSRWCGAKGRGRPGEMDAVNRKGGSACMSQVCRASRMTFRNSLVWDAWLRVKENGGAAGPDGVTIEQFEVKVHDNLYKLWSAPSRAGGGL